MLMIGYCLPMNEFDEALMPKWHRAAGACVVASRVSLLLAMLRYRLSRQNIFFDIDDERCQRAHAAWCLLNATLLHLIPPRSIRPSTRCFPYAYMLANSDALKDGEQSRRCRLQTYRRRPPAQCRAGAKSNEYSLHLPLAPLTATGTDKRIRAASPHHGGSHGACRNAIRRRAIALLPP